MKRLRIILQHKFYIKIITIMFIIYSIIVNVFFPAKSKYNINETSFRGIVTKLNYNKDKITINMNGKENIIVNYYVKNKKELNYLKKKIVLGDTVSVKGILKVPPNNTIPNTFNYKNYLKQNKIYYIIKASSFNKIKNNTSIFYYIKNALNKRIEKISKSKDYLNILLLSNKTIDKDILSTYQANGISHLFSISGMHISLFITIIFYILNRVSYNNYYKYGIAIILLIFYMLLVDTISVKRSIIMFILFSINKLFKLKISNIDIMCLTLIVLIILNSYTIFILSFQYSYLISFFLIIFNTKIKSRKNYFSKLLYVSYLSFLVSFPITIYNFYQINVISIFLNIIYVPLVSLIIFPLCIITFLFPFLDSILFFFIRIIEYISFVVDSINVTKIIISKPPLILICVYYFAIIMSLYKKKYLLFFFTLVLLNKFSVYFKSNMNIIMLDVGQGDSILISYPYNQLNILIDTGGIDNYDLSIQKTLPYLKSVGISKLDYLILTHGDSDHLLEAINIINNFKVDNVIFNKGEYNELELKIIKLLRKKKMNFFKRKDFLMAKQYYFYFLDNNIYNNENDNSTILYFKYNKYKFLFMGDASIKNEELLMKEYKLNDIYFLKVGHHGSKTSSSKYFIDYINPKVSLISVGENNLYHHPHNKAICNLSESKIYRTDEDGSILIKINQEKNNIFTYPA